ncbi:unnamed protein product [Victoria cruziana]
MDSLMCDEELLDSPCVPESPWKAQHRDLLTSGSHISPEQEDFKDALGVYLEKEASYAPVHGYAECLRASMLVDPRLMAVNWMAQSHERFNLSWETISGAVNLLDRFISLNPSDKLKGWLIELLSVACLTIAAKLHEVEVPPLLELQDGFGHLFQPSLVQRMELHVSTSLAWRLNAVTAYSFMGPLIRCLDLACPRVCSTLTKRVTQLLRGAISDINFLDFWPCTVAVAAIKCGLDELLPSQSSALMCNLHNLIPQGRKDGLGTCFALMKERLVDPKACKHSYSPSSPDSVLRTDGIQTVDCPRSSETSMDLLSNQKK